MRIDLDLHPLHPWQPAEALLQEAGSNLSLQYRAVLSSTRSLTQHLERACGRPIQVHLEYQEILPQWEDTPSLWDPHYRIPHDGPVLLRNAWLCADERLLVYAHSQIAMTGLSDEIRLALDKGDQPLGKLFLEMENDGMDRHHLELALAAIPAVAKHTDQDADTAFWCRRSLLSVGRGLRARIVEIFPRSL